MVKPCSCFSQWPGILSFGLVLVPFQVTQGQLCLDLILATLDYGALCCEPHRGLTAEDATIDPAQST